MMTNNLNIWEPPEESMRRLQIDNYPLYFPLELTSKDYVWRVLTCVAKGISRRMVEIVTNNNLIPFKRNRNELDAYELLKRLTVVCSNIKHNAERRIFASELNIAIDQNDEENTILFKAAKRLFVVRNTCAHMDVGDMNGKRLLRNVINNAKDLLRCFEGQDSDQEQQKIEVLKNQFWKHVKFRSDRIQRLYRNGENYDTTTLRADAAQQRQNGRTAAQLMNAGYTATDLCNAGYTATELREAGYAVNDILRAGYTANELKGAGYTANELMEAGYLANELKMADYRAAELREAGYAADDILRAGYEATQLRDVRFSATELKRAGYVVAQLREAGYTASDLRIARYYPVRHLRDAGYPDAEILGAGYSAMRLKAAGYTATQLQMAGYAADDILGAGYTANELREAQYKRNTRLLLIVVFFVIIAFLLKNLASRLREEYDT